MTDPIAAWTIEPGRLWSGEAPLDAPLAVIDLGRADGFPDDVRLPPCPLIGLGERGHPSAGMVDTVIEPPVSAAALAAQVLARPHAAATIVQLLRILPGLSPEAGLTAESMAYGLLQGSSEHRAWTAAQPGPEERLPGRVEVNRTGNLLLVELDNAGSGNAIDRAMRDALYEAFTLAALDRGIDRVSLRGKGRAFSLGAELGEFGTTSDPATAHAIRMLTLPAWAVARIADRLDVHVQGGCVGAGLELAAWGKRITAAPSAWFQLPELAMGILPGAGGCVALTRRIGRQRTALMALSGKRISAKAALGWGLIDAIVYQPSGDQGGADFVAG